MARRGTLFGKPRGEIIKRPGALTAKAKAAGETVSEYIAHPPKGASARTKRQIALAKAFRTMRRKKAVK